MLNDFNTHRNNAKNKNPKIIDDEFCFTSNNNLELNDTNKIDQITLLNNYKNDLNEYNKSLTQNNDEINNKINPNNNVNYYKKEINSIRQQIIILKSKISENELIINDYKNTINVLNTKHTEEINNLNNHINVLNDYILLIYQFFNNIAKKYLPQLNFKFDSNQNQFKLIDINEFQNKLGMIDQYIFDLQNKGKQSQNIEYINDNMKNNESLNSKIMNNNKNFEKINADEEKIRMEKEDKKNDIIKNFNNDFIIQKLKEDNYNSFENKDYNDENNNLGVIQLYKNLENKFDILEKAIEEGKKNRYDILNENYEDIDLNNNNNIILTDYNNNVEQEKNNFLDRLYKNENITQNKKEKKNNKKKKKPLTKISQNNNIKNKKGNYKPSVLVDVNKNKKNSKNDLKNIK